MTSRDRKRELNASWKVHERTVLEASLPISKADLCELFEHLDRSEVPCDHSLRQTSMFLRSRALNDAIVVPWLREHGGYCDCEVLANVADKFGSIAGFEPDV